MDDVKTVDSLRELENTPEFQGLLADVYDVELLTPPEEVKNAIANIGKFASVCKSDADNMPSEKTCRRIGLDCLRAGHGSAVASVEFKFLITNVSRVYSHQQVRHHTGVTYNQASGVFMPTGRGNTKFVVPFTVRAVLAANPELAKRYLTVLSESLAISEELCKLGVSNSDARFIVPVGSTTAIKMSVNLLELIHMSHERLCSRAQWEIRGVLNKIKFLLCELEPALDEFLVPKCVYLRHCNERNGCKFYEHVYVEGKDKVLLVNEAKKIEEAPRPAPNIPVEAPAVAPVIPVEEPKKKPGIRSRRKVVDSDKDGTTPRKSRRTVVKTPELDIRAKQLVEMVESAPVAKEESAPVEVTPSIAEPVEAPPPKRGSTVLSLSDLATLRRRRTK